MLASRGLKAILLSADLVSQITILMRVRTCRHRKEHVIQSWRRKFTLIESKLACAHFAAIVERRSEAQALVLIQA